MVSFHRSFTRLDSLQIQEVSQVPSIASCKRCMLPEGPDSFTKFVSEMKQLRDFWKGIICDQTFIYLVYRIYGCFLYAYQDSIPLNPPFEDYQTIRCRQFVTFSAFLSALIAAGLYGNIGVKVFYNNVLIEFVAALLMTNTRKLIRAGIILVY